MQRITLIALILLALGLGAYVYFYEIRGEDERQAAKDAEKQLFSLKKEDVTAVRVVNPRGTFSFTQQDGRWSITAPSQAPADARSVEDVILGLDAIRYSKVVEEKPTDLTPFGLATPNLQVTITTKEGEKSLLIGEDAPLGGDTYIMRGGDPRVYLSSYPIRARLDKDLVGWRDKKLLDVAVVDIQRLTIQGLELPGLDAVREGDGWVTVSDPRVRLDASQLENMLYDIAALAATSFTGQTDATLFGLENPPLTVTLEVGKDKTRKQLIFGAPYGEEGRLPVVRAQGEEVRLVDAAIREKLTKAVAELRDKRLTALDRFKVDRLEAKVEGQTLTATKDKESWKLDGSLKDKVKPSDVEAILDDVTGLKAEQIVDGVAEADLARYGLDKPSLEVTLHQPDPAKEVKLRFGHAAVEGAEKTYARIDGDPSIYVLTKLILDDMRDVLLKSKQDPAAAGAGAEGSPAGAGTNGSPAGAGTEGSAPPAGTVGSAPAEGAGAAQ